MGPGNPNGALFRSTLRRAPSLPETGLAGWIRPDEADAFRPNTFFIFVYEFSTI